MFEPFSSGYHLGVFYVYPAQGADVAKMQVDDFREAAAHYCEKKSRLFMKIGTSHFAVRGSAEVPSGSLSVPERVLDAANIRNPPELTEVLVAKRPEQIAGLFEVE